MKAETNILREIEQSLQSCHRKKNQPQKRCLKYNIMVVLKVFTLLINIAKDLWKSLNQVKDTYTESGM